jgi:hypothetical protein
MTKKNAKPTNVFKIKPVSNFISPEVLEEEKKSFKKFISEIEKSKGAIRKGTDFLINNNPLKTVKKNSLDSLKEKADHIFHLLELYIGFNYQAQEAKQNPGYKEDPEFRKKIPVLEKEIDKQIDEANSILIFHQGIKDNIKIIEDAIAQVKETIKKI